MEFKINTLIVKIDQVQFELDDIKEQIKSNNETQIIHPQIFNNDTQIIHPQTDIIEELISTDSYQIIHQETNTTEELLVSTDSYQIQFKSKSKRIDKWRDKIVDFASNILKYDSTE